MSTARAVRSARGGTETSLSALTRRKPGGTFQRARQVSPRGGELTCAVVGDRVLLTGRAVLVKSGTFYLDEPDPKDMSSSIFV